MVQFSLTDILEKVQGVKKSGNEYKAQCPAHDDKNPSLSITEKDGKTLLYCHAGCTQQAVLTALGLWEATRPSIGKIVKVYDYVDASGQVLHQTVRYEPKNFRQRRPDPARPGKYIWSLKGIQTVLYRLPDVIRATAAGELVLIVEGEKDADTAATLGYPATTCPMGAGKWNDGHSDILTDAHVVIIPDQDDVGKKHAARVIRSLHKVGCSIRTLHLPAKDLTAWVEQGGTDLDTLLRDVDVTVFASSGSGTRQILISTDITAVLDAAAEALGNMPGAPIVFQRSQGLSRVLRGAKAPKWLTRSPDAPNLMRIDKDYLRELMAASAEWIRLNKNEEEVSSLPPEWAARGLLARGEWTFPLLEGLVTSPTLRPDGSLLDTPGYDPDTGLYYVADGTTYPPISNAPRQNDAASAIGDLQEVIQDFRFADERLHQSVTYAAILTLAARHAYAGNTPAFVVTANTPASGKGLLVDVICLIGTGITVAKMPQTTDIEEERKRLLSLALDGDATLCIDNVAHPFGSSTLDMALTGGTIKDRRLGTNTNATAPWIATVFATGNNVTFRGDTMRRSLIIDIDPRMANPEARTDFTHKNLLKWVRKHRPRLLMSALTIVRAYLQAGAPDQSIDAFGSFEGWSDFIRSALVWTTGIDPLVSRKAATVTHDQGLVDLGTFLTCWETCYGTTSKALADAIRDTSGKGNALRGPGASSNEWDDLYNAIAAFDPGYTSKHGINVRKVGWALRRYIGRMVGARRLVQDPTSTSQGTRYLIQNIA